MLSEIRQINALYSPQENTLIFSIYSDAGCYSDTWSNFTTDSGLTLPALDSSVYQRVYIQGVCNNFMDRNDPSKVIGTDTMPWAVGDQALANVVAIIAAQQTRRVPPGNLMQLKAVKANQLRASAVQVINSGFMSSALGAPHLYPSFPAARADMTASVPASLMPDLASDWTTPFWCTDTNDKEALRDHTVAQIRQAGSDGKAMVDAVEEKLASLLALADTAPDDEALAAVIWR